MKPTVFFAESTYQLETRLHEVFSGKGSPNLAIVFCSVIHDMNSVRRVFNSFDIAVFGASTSGEIVNTEVHEETIAVMLLDLPENSFAMSFFEAEGQSSLELGKKAGIWAKTFHDAPSILVMASGMHTQGEQIVKGILDTAGEETALFGCIASYDPAIIQEDPETFVFSDTKVSTNGMTVLAFKKNTEGGNALILFSCRARLLSLGPMIKDEVKAVRDIWHLPDATGGLVGAV